MNCYLGHIPATLIQEYHFMGRGLITYRNQVGGANVLKAH